MQNKKLYFLIPLAILLVTAAAFIGGRLLNLNRQSGAVGDGSLINILPAPEIPTTQPETTGSLVGQQDNILTLQLYSMDAGGGGDVIVSTGAGDSGTGESTNVGTGNDGPKVEVLITKESKIYCDVTQFSDGQSNTIQQVVEASSLDKLGKNAMLTVWGRKNGDRIIADVVLFTNLP